MAPTPTRAGRFLRKRSAPPCTTRWASRRKRSSTRRTRVEGERRATGTGHLRVTAPDWCAVLASGEDAVTESKRGDHMNPECLAHRLMASEREFFNANGYLIVEDALDAATVSRLIGAVDRIDTRERTADTRDKLLSFTNIVHEDSAFVDMLDCPTVFPKVWGILGWNMYLYHSHLDVTPPANEAALKWRVAWHQDSMRVNDEIETSPRPRLSLKVAFYLTDVSQPDRGNTLVVPGSH